LRGNIGLRPIGGPSETALLDIGPDLFGAAGAARRRTDDLHRAIASAALARASTGGCCGRRRALRRQGERQRGLTVTASKVTVHGHGHPTARDVVVQLTGERRKPSGRRRT